MRLLDSIADYIDKARSRIYGIFLFWILVFGSPVIFTALFVDQEIIYKKYGQLKGEYIIHTFFDFTHWWPGVYAPIILVGAAALTFLMIWILPRTLVKKSYQRELDDQYDREFMKIKKDDDLAKKQSGVLEKQKTVVKAEEEIAKKQNELESKEENVWLKEYNDFKKTKLYDQFYLIPESVYQHYGSISVENEYDRSIFEVPTDLVSYADGKGLIKVDVNNRQINLTDKGRFFMTHYQEDKK